MLRLSAMAAVAVTVGIGGFWRSARCCSISGRQSSGKAANNGLSPMPSRARVRSSAEAPSQASMMSVCPVFAAGDLVGSLCLAGCLSATG
jgi:hypothetical protein